VKGQIMTQNGNLKRRVRARAAKTGESYTAALQHVDSDDSPDGIPIKNRTRFRELTGRDSDLIPDSFST
jgi:hypothetical protein